MTMSHRLPDGPTAPEIAQAVAYHRDPLGVLRRAQARHGPLFTLRFPLKEPIVFMAVPDALPALLESDPGRATAGAARRSILPQASPSSPFGGDGQAHATSRARMWPGFAPGRSCALEPSIAELAEEHARGWPRGHPFRLLEATRQLCTEIAVGLVLAVTDAHRRRALVAAIRRMLNTPGNPPLPLPGGDEGPRGMIGKAADREFARRSAEVRRLLREELRERHAREEPGDDLLGGILSSSPPLPDEEIVDQLLIVVMAAQEPPAIALANVLYELARRPAVAEQFLAEPATRSSIIAEVIRLRPSASAALRKLTEPMPIAGHVLPTGTVVACPSLLLHRHPEAFPDPDAFWPDRFAHGTADHAPYFPFGGGARGCLGQNLAEAEFRAVLPAVLERFRLTPAWPREERMVVRATVLVPHRSALVTARSR